MARPELNEKSVFVYLPTKADKERWENAAKDKRVTLSKFVYETVENSMAGEARVPRDEIAKELSEIKEENRKLKEELKLKSLVLDKYETELYKLRHASFEESDEFQGIRGHGELTSLLKRGRVLKGYEILKELGVDPKDSDAAKLISNQLEALRRFGLVEEITRGWRWIG